MIRFGHPAAGFSGFASKPICLLKPHKGGKGCLPFSTHIPENTSESKTSPPLTFRNNEGLRGNDGVGVPYRIQREKPRVQADPKTMMRRKTYSDRNDCECGALLNAEYKTLLSGKGQNKNSWNKRHWRSGRAGARPPGGPVFVAQRRQGLFGGLERGLRRGGTPLTGPFPPPGGQPTTQNEQPSSARTPSTKQMISSLLSTC